MFEYSSVIAGSSLAAAHLLLTNNFKYVVNFFGGWHHARRYDLFLFQFNYILFSILIHS